MKTIITADNAVGTQAATNRKGACAGVLQRVGARLLSDAVQIEFDLRVVTKIWRAVVEAEAEFGAGFVVGVGKSVI
ncbi:MAG TPA: hypothetical protein VJL59_03505 [Anaerolineales bacterium]|nr:hypothetical protein [Anaerolineales bacterium]